MTLQLYLNIQTDKIVNLILDKAKYDLLLNMIFSKEIKSCFNLLYGLDAPYMK
jgi:hypothetical protein